MTIIDCPFDPCAARVDLVAEQRSPMDEVSTLLRVPPHPTEPDSWFGLCPASLMKYPIGRQAAGQLEDQARVHGHMKTSRDAQPQAESRPAPEPKPRPDARWFRPQTGHNPRGEAAPPPPTPMPQVLTPRQPLGYLPGSRPTEGESMASVADTKAAIDQANGLIDEARQAAKAASDKFLEAAAVVNHLQGESVHALGGPELARAMENCDAAVVAASLAIEKNTTYGETL